MGAAAAVAAVGASVLAYGASGGTGPTRSTSSSGGTGASGNIGTVWRSYGTTVFQHSIPGNYEGFSPTTTVTCAGESMPTCYVAIHANGVLPDGRLSTPGKWGAAATPFVSNEFVSNDAGRTWHSMVFPDKAWVSSPFSCPTAKECGVGPLVGAHNDPGAFTAARVIVLTTRDRGHTWTVHPLPASAGLVRELDCTTIEACVALTWTRPATVVDGMVPDGGTAVVFPTELYATRDAGATWAAVPLPRAPAGDVYSLRSVACPTALRCILSGWRVHVKMAPGYTTVHAAHPYLPTRTTTVIVNVDTRARDTTLQVHPAGPLSCVSAQQCVMVAPMRTLHRSRFVDSHFFVSTDGGKTWSKRRGTSHVTGPASLQCLSITSCLVRGARGESVTNDGGMHWTGGTAAASCSRSGICVGLEPVRVHDPNLPLGDETISATGVVTTARAVPATGTGRASLIEAVP